MFIDTSGNGEPVLIKGCKLSLLTSTLDTLITTVANKLIYSMGKDWNNLKTGDNLIDFTGDDSWEFIDYSLNKKAILIDDMNWYSIEGLKEHGWKIK